MRLLAPCSSPPTPAYPAPPDASPTLPRRPPMRSPAAATACGLTSRCPSSLAGIACSRITGPSPTRNTKARISTSTRSSTSASRPAPSRISASARRRLATIPTCSFSGRMPPARCRTSPATSTPRRAAPSPMPAARSCAPAAATPTSSASTSRRSSTVSAIAASRPKPASSASNIARSAAAPGCRSCRMA